MKGTLIKSIMIILIFLSGCSQKPSETQNGTQQEVVNELPDMVVTLQDNSTVDLRKINGSVILVFFQPDCDHCQQAAKEIRQNILSFEKTTLYFITSHPFEITSKFARDHELADYKNIIFSWASVEAVLGSYGPISTPSIYIYSDEQKLIKSFNGNVKIEEVLKFV